MHELIAYKTMAGEVTILKELKFKRLSEGI
jgi:hypothetical protein